MPPGGCALIQGVLSPQFPGPRKVVDALVPAKGRVALLFQDRAPDNVPPVPRRLSEPCLREGEPHSRVCDAVELDVDLATQERLQGGMLLAVEWLDAADGWACAWEGWRLDVRGGRVLR